MDYFFLRALAAQLQQQLAGALFNKIYQPDDATLLLRLWNGGATRRLHLSCGGGGAVYITDEEYRNPMRPPRFCQLLRARLKRLERVCVSDDDRLLIFICRGGDGKCYQLLAEMFGRSSDIYLLDGDGVVIDSMQRKSTVLRSGSVYHQARREQLIPLEQAAASLPDSAIRAWLLEQVWPTSRWLAEHVAAADDCAVARQRLEHFAACWNADRMEPHWWNGSAVLRPAEELLDVDLSAWLARQHARGQDGTVLDGELLKVVKKGLKRLRRRLRNIDEQLCQCENSRRDKEYGDLVLANLHLIKRGMDGINVIDYYADAAPTIRLELDSSKTAQQNAEAYYKRYRKAQRGREHCQRRRQLTNNELAWLEQIEQQLSDPALSAADADIIRQELMDSGYYRPQRAIQSGTRMTRAEKLVNSCTSPGGWKVIWGNNNRTNDYISRHLLHPADLWLHAHKIPGAHVVIKCAGGEVAAEDIHFAAAIAAAHSRAGSNTSVEVMVAVGRRVQRIKGAPPGLVRVQEYQVVQVRPATENHC